MEYNVLIRISYFIIFKIVISLYISYNPINIPNKLSTHSIPTVKEFH